uniref:ATP synthase F0 subunit 8 n=1 Tax=Eulepetopsis sp. TaxID=3071118 RepID=A0AA96KGT9_9GAST|nr:ATP synthase F0 subunit 8 [Eulepetopsis sp.]
MPQLGPINWLFVYMFFWIVVLGFCIIIWWESDVSFNINYENLNDKVSGKAEDLNWMW